MTGWFQGHGLILDDSYRVVKSIEAGGPSASTDMHEFKLLDGGRSTIVTSYRRYQWDMTPWGLNTGTGWLQESRFQEISTDTGEMLFQWASLDHIPPSDGRVGLDTTRGSGSGVSSEDPWAYFHLNSVDKFLNGDYLLSGRHTSFMYRVNGRTGEILWRLDGSPTTTKSSYAKQKGLEFSWQHDARVLKDSTEDTIISIFDNGEILPGLSTPEHYSSGKIIQLFHVNLTACLLRSYTAPRTSISSSQGNMQLIGFDIYAFESPEEVSSGNAVIGWGNLPSFTEMVAATGEVVLDATFASDTHMLYRVFKCDWKARPLTIPALWAYLLTNSSTRKFGQPASMSCYMSWNGATEIRNWRLHGSPNKKEGPWESLRVVAKNGFETVARLEDSYAWTYAEALGENGEVLGVTEKVSTFVPGEALKMSGLCDEIGCFTLDELPGGQAANIVAEHRQKGPLLYVIVASTFLGIVLFMLWKRRRIYATYIPIKAAPEGFVEGEVVKRRN